MPVSDPFGIEGIALLGRWRSTGRLTGPYGARVDPLRRIWSTSRSTPSPASSAVRRRDRRHQPVPGRGQVDLRGRAHPAPRRVRRRGPPRQITKQGSSLVRWAAVESVQRLPATSYVGGVRDQVAARRGKNIGKVAATRGQLVLVYYALRDHHVRALTRRAAA